MKPELKTEKFFLQYKEEQIENTLLWESHCHANFELIAVIDGGISVTLEGRNYRLNRGEAIVIPPLSYHAIKVNKAGVYKRLTVLFDQSSIPEVLAPRFSGNSILINNLSAYLTSELQRICTENDKDFYSPLAESFMTEILYTLARAAEDPIANERDGLLEKIILYVDENLCNQILLDDLAAHTSRSKSSVCHLFEEKMKISPKQYILQKKLALATHLIKSGTPPTSAAIRVGYDNYSNFYRIYKKYYGVSPTSQTSQSTLRPRLDGDETYTLREEQKL